MVVPHLLRPADNTSALLMLPAGCEVLLATDTDEQVRLSGRVRAHSRSAIPAVESHFRASRPTGARPQVMMAWERPYMVACIDALRIDATCAQYSAYHVATGCHGVHTIHHTSTRCASTRRTPVMLYASCEAVLCALIR
jgi:hypothetical protein